MIFKTDGSSDLRVVILSFWEISIFASLLVYTIFPEQFEL